MAKQDKIICNFDSSITANATLHFDLDAKGSTDDNGTRTDQLVPFRNLKLYNNGNSVLKVYTNGRKGYNIVPKGTILTIDDDRIENVKVINADAIDGNFIITLDSNETQLSILKGILGYFLKRLI